MSGEAQSAETPIFRVGGATTQGAQHAKKGLPNQDAIAWCQPAPGGLPILLALSDGHGGSTYFRSDKGSELAVEAALTVGRELAEQAEQVDERQDLRQFLTLVASEAGERMPKRIVSEWLERVREHLESHPFTEEELEHLAATNPKALDRVRKDGHLAYGATLLLVIVTRHFLVFCQLGDGDILRVAPDGETQEVFPAGTDQVGEDTESLCMANAWQEFQVQVVPAGDGHPPLILASTDGYSKSFVSAADFRRIGSDYLEMIRRQGVDAVAKELRGFLIEASQGGSGDDVSLGFIRCSEPDDVETRHARREALARSIIDKADRSEVDVRLHRVREELSAAIERLESRCDKLEMRARRLIAACIACVAIGLVLVAAVAWWRPG